MKTVVLGCPSYRVYCDYNPLFSHLSFSADTKVNNLKKLCNSYF